MFNLVRIIKIILKYENNNEVTWRNVVVAYRIMPDGPQQDKHTGYALHIHLYTSYIRTLAVYCI
jgi:hypothetical protein